MIVVVGHGPSLKHAGLGGFIDDFDVIIRCGARGVRLTDDKRPDYGKKPGIQFHRQDEYARRVYQPFEERMERTTHPSKRARKFSTGTAAVIWAMQTYKQPVAMLGMDAVASGDGRGYYSNQDWEHDALLERQIICEISAELGVPVIALRPL